MPFDAPRGGGDPPVRYRISWLACLIAMLIGYGIGSVGDGDCTKHVKALRDEIKFWSR